MTIWENVFRLDPASYITIKPGSDVKISKYWDINLQNKSNINFHDAKTELNNILSDAVKIRMISDVPLGAFLSGGHDSSIIVGLMSRLSSKPVKTFSVGFEDRDFSELKYAKTDEWVKVEGNTAVVGISDHAQDQLSDVVFVEMTVSVDDVVAQGDSGATIESVKAAADVNLPVSGKVIEINEVLSDSPETLNEDPYGEGWMIKIEMSDPAELDNLMDATAYEKHCEEAGH